MADVPNGYPINGGDFPVINLSGADIAAFTCVVFDVVNLPTFDQCAAVKTPATSGAVTHPAGITIDAIANGKTGRMRRIGAAKATSSGAVAAGDYVRVDSAAGHEGQAKLAATGEAAIGQCMIGGADATLIFIAVGICTAP